MKVIESIRYNRTGEVNEAVIYDGNESSLTGIMLVAQAFSARETPTQRNLFTTVAIRVEF